MLYEALLDRCVSYEDNKNKKAYQLLLIGFFFRSPCWT